MLGLMNNQEVIRATTQTTQLIQTEMRTAVCTGVVCTLSESLVSKLLDNHMAKEEQEVWGAHDSSPGPL
jgi:hypothetical protein